MNSEFIDIIIPCGDSLEELKVTINSLLLQKEFINNIFIIISGTNKKNLKIEIKEYIYNSKKNFKINVLEDNSKLNTPGSARNCGIIKSSYTSATFIGFIDSSMSVNKNWLSSFYRDKDISDIRLGSTKYLPNKKMELISALISYGTRYSTNTVPGTIIKKKICKYFPTSIRWGEDLIWMNNYSSNFNSKPIFECSYTYFNKSIFETFIKYIDQIKDALKNKSTYRRNLYLQAFFSLSLYLLLVITTFYLNYKYIILILITYYIYRFIKKNKIVYLSRVEGIISITLYILLDLIKIFIIIRSLV